MLPAELRGIGIEGLNAQGVGSTSSDAVETILDHLLTDGLGCAPHVLSRLVAELRGDERAIRQIVERLTPAQRGGLRPLPIPLPVVPAIAALFGDLILPARDRDLLLALSVCLDDDLGPLVEFDGRSAAEIAAAPVGRHLIVRAGRTHFAEPRLAIWVRGRTDPTVVRRIHDRLSEVFGHRGDRVSADWHRARASLDRDPAAAAELTRIARELSEAGHPDRALLLAREATVHAAGAARDEARLVAGASSVGAGFAVEAAEWLGSLFPGGTERYRLQGLAGLITARAHLQGIVPEVDPDSLRPRSDDRDDWYAWTRAAALAAVLCAERGDRSGMRTWLKALRAGTARVGAERELRDPVVALSWLIVGEPDLDGAVGTGPLTGRMLRALRAAIEGDVDFGLRVLTAADSPLSADRDPLVEGFEHSPVVRAYQAVVEVLLLIWRGDIGSADERMRSAALELPIGIPLAGLGVVLVRRLDLAVRGELGPISRALTASLPPAAKIDVIVDRGIESFLAGAFGGAASSIRLWLDLGAPQTTLSVPGLDEVALTNEIGDAAPTFVGPPEVFLAHELRMRLATATDGRWRMEHDAVQEAARTLRSPFARGRVELMLGAHCAIRDESAVARSHLLAAQHLFELSGAVAWARSAGDRLARLEPDESDVAAVADPLWSCRHAWTRLLTARELEVAMRAVAGAPNRDIAAALNVSVRTVEVHLGRVFAKLDVRGRVELTALAHRTNQHL
ncbi:helix-turn-helix transcriptional regulator [Microbacterium sp. SA39]|uniref:helix-turn-helix transcriptional regulator n=1 Tax=Microbacterium sp. SA39 TaxID=1263625 RepID=UPI0005FA51A6|nr:LuxR C-terminal-related transcriptional regulator [Microbacterium sp. SA39]KJQ53126.1 Transcriptional regulatory protein LiaR [Microbacterium sp. SA39]